MSAGMRWWIVGPIALVVLVGVGWSPPGRTAVKASLFVLQILPQVPFRPQEWLGPEPRVREVRFATARGEGVADLYEPAQGRGKRGAVLLFLGVNPAGRDDPRVVNLGKALARAGVITLIPWSEPLVQKRLEVGEVEVLVAAFQYLMGLPQVDSRRVGMGGFCVGAAFALIAATDPRIRERVAFVNALSVYADATDVLAQIASRTRFWDGLVEPWDPDPLTREVFEMHLLASLEGEEQERVLRALRGEGVAGPPLSPAAEAVLRLLEGPSLEEARALVARLPPHSLALLEGISPVRYVDNLRAPVLIMQDRDDALLPSFEARRLALALQGRVPVRYTEFSLFRHVDPARPLAPLSLLRETVQLFRHLYTIFSIVG